VDPAGVQGVKKEKKSAGKGAEARASMAGTATRPTD
jgi:hypothetical protein